MAMAIDQTQGGLTYGTFGTGLHGTAPGNVAQQVHDGDTVNVRAIGNFAIRFLGIDTPEVSFTLPGRGARGALHFAKHIVLRPAEATECLHRLTPKSARRLLRFSP